MGLILGISRSRRAGRVAGVLAAAVAVGAAAWRWDDLFEKRVVVVVPGKVVRGAWQRPGPLRRIIEREKIRTIVSLTAINQDDPKYVDQARVVRETGVRWIFVPMRGSTASVEQMAEAADLLADPGLRPVFFHCVAGHHRSSLAQAAYRVRSEGWDAARAWDEVSRLAWARPSADGADRRRIEEFAASRLAAGGRPGRDDRHETETRPGAEVGLRRDPGGGDPARGLPGLERGDGEPGDRRPRAGLPLGADERGGPGEDSPRP